MRVGKSWVGVVLGLWALLLTSVANAVPVTVTIEDIEIADADHNQDAAATLYRYMVSSAYIGAPLSVTNVPHVGVCALAQPTDNAAGCQNRIKPAAGAWSFTRDVPASAGTVDVLIQVRDENAVKINPLDISPGPASPGEWGLALTVNLADGSWRVRNDPTSVNPTQTSSSVIGSIDPNRLTGRVKFSVARCSGGTVCSDGGQLVCQGSACTTGAGSGPTCSGIAGTVSCAAGYACNATPLPVPEQQNGVDDDCDGAVDECNDSQIGQTFDCVAPLRACAAQAGLRTCTTANSPPGACVPFGADDPNICQATCAAEISVSNVVELREAIAQAPLTACKDVIVLDPGYYDVTTPLVVDDSMEIRGIGSSFDCEGVDFDQKLTAATLDSNLGSFHCDGDDGEDAGLTVIRNLTRPADPFEQSMHRVMEIGTATSKPEVTLRHLTISGGWGQQEATPASGILARGPSRLRLFNVVVEDNLARGPGAGIVHAGESSDFPIAPTFVMVNSTVRRNRSITPPLGAGIGVQGNGGGMVLTGVAFVLRSTINDNTGIRGAGMLVGGVLHLYNSTVTRNLAGQGGAGVMVAPVDGNGFLELRNNTITNNFAQWFAQQPPQRKDGAGVLVIGNVKVEAFGNIIADNVECRSFSIQGPNAENCSIDEGASVLSLGSNVGSADCGFSPSISLPGSGPANPDKVVTLGYPRDLDEPMFPRFGDPFETAVQTTCQLGTSITNGRDPEAYELAAAYLEARTAMPSSNRETFDFNSGAHVRLLGGLAYQGGRTQTIAPTTTSPALGAARSAEDPGITTDPYPSAQPLCPTADQRGYTISGFAPAVCDAGAFQTTATAAQSVDGMAGQLSQLFPDSDGDGIADTIDANAMVQSLSFSDLAGGGVTSGVIQTAGNQSLRLFDAFPNPGQGILALALSGGGSTPAILKACAGSVEVTLSAGQQQVITCPEQPAVCVMALESLSVGDRVQLNVDGVFGGQVAFGPSSLSSDLSSVGNIAVIRSTIAGDVLAAGQVTVTAPASIAGITQSNAYVLPRSLESQDVTVGTTDVSVGNDQTRSIVAGNYRNLRVGDRAQITLAAGSYAFESIVLSNDSRVILADTVRVKSQNQLTVGDRVRVTQPSGAPAPGNLTLWYTNALVVSLGHDVLWSGTIVAPSAALTLLDRASVDGCVAGKQVSISNDASVVAARTLPTAAGGAAGPSCRDGLLNQNETDLDCGGGCAGCGAGQDCQVNADCAAGSCIAGVCTASSACTVASATDLGAPGQQTSLSTSGCFRVNSGYPSWWGIRTMKLETTTAGSYPVPYTWSNACGGGGSGVFTGDWQAQFLPNISSACATLVDLQGSGGGNVTLRYWAQ